MHISTHIIINNASQEEFDNLPEDKKEELEALLKEINKEFDKVLDKNPNL